MPKLLKIVFTFKFHPLHAKISTPTGTPVPDEKVKELSSIEKILQNTAVFELDPWCKVELVMVLFRKLLFFFVVCFRILPYAALVKWLAKHDVLGSRCG